MKLMQRQDSPVKARANKESILIESSNILMFLLTIILSWSYIISMESYLST